MEILYLLSYTFIISMIFYGLWITKFETCIQLSSILIIDIQTSFPNPFDIHGFTIHRFQICGLFPLIESNNRSKLKMIDAVWHRYIIYQDLEINIQHTMILIFQVKQNIASLWNEKRMQFNITYGVGNYDKYFILAKAINFTQIYFSPRCS